MSSKNVSRHQQPQSQPQPTAAATAPTEDATKQSGGEQGGPVETLTPGEPLKLAEGTVVADLPQDGGEATEGGTENNLPTEEQDNSDEGLIDDGADDSAGDINTAATTASLGESVVANTAGAAVAGESKVAERAPVIEAAIQKVTTPAEAFEELYKQITETQGVPAVVHDVAGFMTPFVTRTAPRARLEPADMNTLRKSVIFGLQSILSRNYDEFETGWNTLIAYFQIGGGEAGGPNKVKTALGEEFAGRFADRWRGSNEDLQLFFHLFSLLRYTVTNPKKRGPELAKEMNIDAIGVGVLDEKQKNNLKTFYGV